MRSPTATASTTNCGALNGFTLTDVFRTLPKLHHTQNFQDRIRAVIWVPKLDDYRTFLMSEECVEMAQMVANLA